MHGVVSRRRDRALFAAVQMTTSASAVPLPVRLPGLDPARSYRVEVVAGPDTHPLLHAPPTWTSEPDGLLLTGAALAGAGFGLPTLPPESAVLLRVFVP